MHETVQRQVLHLSCVDPGDRKRGTKKKPQQKQTNKQTNKQKNQPGGQNRTVDRSEPFVCLFVGWFTPSQQQSVSQGRVDCMCCHAELKVTDQTRCPSQLQYVDTRQTCLKEFYVSSTCLDRNLFPIHRLRIATVAFETRSFELHFEG